MRCRIVNPLFLVSCAFTFVHAYNLRTGWTPCGNWLLFFLGSQLVLAHIRGIRSTGSRIAGDRDTNPVFVASHFAWFSAFNLVLDTGLAIASFRVEARSVSKTKVVVELPKIRLNELRYVLGDNAVCEEVPNSGSLVEIR